MIPATGLTAQSTIPALGLPVFGFFLGLSILLGMVYVFTYGAKKYEIPRPLILQWLAIGATGMIAVAHWVDLLFYRPETPFFANGEWLKFFSGISSTGGMVGGLLGSVVFVYLYRAPWERYVALGFEGCALVWGVGRIGCALLNEHLAGPTNFFLGVRFPDGQTRHDLGLYECLFLLLVLAPYVWRRRRAVADPLGTVAAISLRYGLFRFAIDFMRDEPRYAGLTFAQLFSFFLVMVAAALLLHRRRGNVLAFS